jgi:hypothetical protein
MTDIATVRERVSVSSSFVAIEDTIGKCAYLLDRAVRTLRALPKDDPHRIKNSWPDVIRDPLEAYGYTEVGYPRFRPSPRDVSVMLQVLGWITWLQHRTGSDGPRDATVIVERAFQTPWWVLAQRFHRSDRTIQRWYDGAVTRIAMTYMGEIKRISI